MRHDVRDLFDLVAMGATPSSADIDDIDTDPGVNRAQLRNMIEGAVAVIHQARAAGERGEARKLAAAAAREITDFIGDAPARFDRDDRDPRAIAAEIPRSVY